ncbi:retrovirus-related Pol polyprotein from type-1 retrotransposable element R2 [Helicoverpa armigera]|uniref:retrovirus-related Pol polyprotein from type-1 retrotransposable element R2 n=1 Tax=Helicoverpa armigera TaxID=29058 RepID=UPI003083A5BA
MAESRRIFKRKLKWCQNNKEQIKMNIIASHHDAKNFSSFWKSTNSLNHRSSLPASVEGVSDPSEIANLFSKAFKVESPLGPSSGGSEVVGGSGDMPIRFTAVEVATVIKSLKRGKSPGHDGLSVEHLRHAGKHLPRVLAMLFSLCVSHSYLPADLLKTIVLPILKNKTGDSSDKGNYRPISLATVIAKVLDGLFDRQLDKHLTLHDAQFGFKPHLSTETAILCLKQTVRYYTSRQTPVYACFLDLSKAFDLVSYDCLWGKLSQVTNLPGDVVNMLKYWYNNQYNYVKWAGVLSDAYRLDCGVRQGGLSSPKLFNLYVNQLICELSNTNIGCSIDGHCVNNISYADDMVLLSPSISALRRLLRICEDYAVTHGLRYNAVKSELMVFKAGNKCYDIVPPVTLAGTPLTRVTQFKYLGHWVTDSLSDDMDLERERRALAVRCNMLARRFARCTKEVKITLFRAYCQSLYTCALWVGYTKSSYNALRVQYNNAFRVMLGLPRFCSASGMFAEAGVPDFHAIMRTRIASLMRRVRDSSNSLVAIVANRLDSPMMWHWMTTHCASFTYIK